ncbi:MAG: VacJ family lipoprotein [Gammaproteobacteria bacterium]|nr:VacJ family lipoprotein [Gammaproteobacteria bacterium]
MRFRSLAVGACLASLINGCASVGARPSHGSDDPLKPINKKIFVFNQRLDEAVLKPTATAYTDITPLPLRRGISNVFNNIKDVGVIINETLQGRPVPALLETARFLVNSSLGMLGIVDVATPLGLSAHQADFGETLGVWGVPSGPYVVLPLFGPSDVRDSFGLIGDLYSNPATYLTSSAAQWDVYVAQTINTRAEYLHQGALLQIAAGGDEYAFVREAFWQKRRHAIAVHRGEAHQ